MGQCFSDVAAGQQAAGAASGPDRNLEISEAVGAVAGTKGLSTQVELSFSASNLRDRDKFSKSDPMLVAYVRNKDLSFTEFGRTEVVLNSLEPTWVTQLSIVYNFEEVQPLRFVVYDVDTKLREMSTQNLNLEDQQFLGQTDVMLPEIIRAPKQYVTKPLQEKKNAGAVTYGRAQLTIRAEEMQNSKFLVLIRARCSKLSNLDRLSKSDPFLRISRLSEQGILPVFKTEVKKNNLNPEWKPIKVTLQQLCNGDMVRPLSIECFDFDSDGSHDLIGKTEASAKELQLLAESKDSKDLHREHPEHQRIVKKFAGRLHIDEFTITPYHTFLDYVFGGCEISFMVSIDFTASNGSPYNSDSLHYVDPSGRPNAYQTAIRAVGEVVQYYDTDKRFPAWGFGGRPIDGSVSHCFALNGNEHDAVVDGVQGILQAYAQALRNVHLAGPTLFAPTINMAASIAREVVSQEQQKYFVLLIITDGVITDMDQTILSLIAASNLPLSVLIVGVGDANFTDMETLDSDKIKLSAPTGQVAIRDIVQFVPMRAVARGANLANMLLAELPFQLLSYMKLKDIVPNKPAPTLPA